MNDLMLLSIAFVFACILWITLYEMAPKMNNIESKAFSSIFAWVSGIVGAILYFIFGVTVFLKYISVMLMINLGAYLIGALVGFIANKKQWWKGTEYFLVVYISLSVICLAATYGFWSNEIERESIGIENTVIEETKYIFEDTE